MSSYHAPPPTPPVVSTLGGGTRGGGFSPATRQLPAPTVPDLEGGSIPPSRNVWFGNVSPNVVGRPYNYIVRSSVGIHEQLRYDLSHTKLVL